MSDLSKQRKLSKFIDDVENQLKTRIHYFENGYLKIKTIMGPDKEKIFKFIDVRQYAPEDRKINLVYELWTEFWEIYNEVKKNELKSADLKFRTFNWLKNYIKAYGKDEIIVYIHIFVSHLHEFVELHGDVNLFNQEGLEKLNNITSVQFFKSTNKRNNNHAYLQQLMHKRIRMEVISKTLYTDN